MEAVKNDQGDVLEWFDKCKSFIVLSTPLLFSGCHTIVANVFIQMTGHIVTQILKLYSATTPGVATEALPRFRPPKPSGTPKSAADHRVFQIRS